MKKAAFNKRSKNNNNFVSETNKPIQKGEFEIAEADRPRDEPSPDA